MMLTHCGNNVRNRYSGCVFSVKDIVPVPLKTSRNQKIPSRNFDNRLSISILRNEEKGGKFEDNLSRPFGITLGQDATKRTEKI